jgi:murein L,D-transpeptidase YcbB/YkuD
MMGRASRYGRGVAGGGFVRLAAAAAAVALLAAACGDDGDDDEEEADPVAAAEARVSTAEEAVSEAEAGLDEATEAFCDDASDYITAVDRYGDALDDTEPTVGDVKTAGADLAEPREAAESSAESAVEARDQLVEAEQELVEAQVALVEAQSGTSAPEDSSTTTTTEPIVPPATIDRVEQAEDDLTTASEGITDQTSLAEAGARFNAAAFALEVAWLRLFADAGCLSDDQEAEAVAALAEYTTALQTGLQTAGYYDGEVDGLYGPATVAAVEALQTDADLPVTGYVDRATAAALDGQVAAAGGQAASEAAAHTAAVQSTLKLAGYWTGPVDGTWTPELTEALTAFQTALGVTPSGEVDTATLNALEEAIAEGQDALTSTTEETDDTTSTSD